MPKCQAIAKQLREVAACFYGEKPSLQGWTFASLRRLMTDAADELERKDHNDKSQRAYTTEIKISDYIGVIGEGVGSAKKLRARRARKGRAS